MSVYTVLSTAEIRDLLSEFDLGDYLSHQGISAGVENTNYFVETNQQKLVLTLFEKHSIDDLPFYLQLGEFLHNNSCKVPQPYRCKAGEFIKLVKGKPAVFIERLSGQHVTTSPSHSLEIATALADIHNAVASFPLQHAHSHGQHWIHQTANEIKEQLSADDAELLTNALTLVEFIPDDLPKGIIHADLFHDNALFEGDQITGIIDWYFAGHDSFALDIAITMNDWCLTKDGLVDLIACENFIVAYQESRKLSERELTSLPLLQIQSATRFWLSRWLAKKEHARSSDEITVKDPEQMKKLIMQLIDYTAV